MTIADYELLIKAHELKNVDKMFHIHLQAFLNRNVKAEKKVGKATKPVYDKFKKFFDYEKELDRILNKTSNKNQEKPKFSGLGDLLKKGVRDE
ncbi:hypothetical protein [Pseudolactococcus yaeyamensis]